MPLGGTKRVSATPGSSIVPGVSTRSGKKYSANFQQDSAEDQLNPQPKNKDTASVVQGEEEDRPTNPILDWSAFDEQTNADAHAISEQLETVPEGK